LPGKPKILSSKPPVPHTTNEKKKNLRKQEVEGDFLLFDEDIREHPRANIILKVESLDVFSLISGMRCPLSPLLLSIVQ
jgi:hypothetical protein